jgi:uncharacterized protein (TIGR01777 family)
MKVAITGATGFVGRRLVSYLQQSHHDVQVWARNPEKARLLFPAAQFPQVTLIPYDPSQPGPWQEALEECDGVVNLAGEPIADRWTGAKRQAILDSRVQGTRCLVEAIQRATQPPQVLINASAIGYYGTSETATFTETSPPGQDFLAQVCQAWEGATIPLKNTPCRVVIFRLGIVLGKGGGALERMLLPFQLFMGGPLGSGQQWFSWIHREDVVRGIAHALTQPDLQGVFNLTAPQPVKMAELCHTLGEVLSRPSWLPVPPFALELLLGDAAQVVLEGQRVLPQRLLEGGFGFQYPDLKPALEEITAG